MHAALHHMILPSMHAISRILAWELGSDDAPIVLSLTSCPYTRGEDHHHLAASSRPGSNCYLASDRDSSNLEYLSPVTYLSTTVLGSKCRGGREFQFLNQS